MQRGEEFLIGDRVRTFLCHDVSIGQYRMMWKERDTIGRNGNRFLVVRSSGFVLLCSVGGRRSTNVRINQRRRFLSRETHAPTVAAPSMRRSRRRRRRQMGSALREARGLSYRLRNVLTSMMSDPQRISKNEENGVVLKRYIIRCTMAMATQFTLQVRQRLLLERRSKQR